jgi:hypothetical protein
LRSTRKRGASFPLTPPGSPRCLRSVSRMSQSSALSTSMKGRSVQAEPERRLKRGESRGKSKENGEVEGERRHRCLCLLSRRQIHRQVAQALLEAPRLGFRRQSDRFTRSSGAQLPPRSSQRPRRPPAPSIEAVARAPSMTDRSHEEAFPPSILPAPACEVA